MSESRRWPRISLHLEVTLRFPSLAEAAAAATLDVSRSGVFLAMRPAKPIGTTVNIAVMVGDGIMQLEGVVVREDENGVGVFLTKVCDGWNDFCDEMTERKQRHTPQRVVVVERVRKGDDDR